MHELVACQTANRFHNFDEQVSIQQQPKQHTLFSDKQRHNLIAHTLLCESTQGFFVHMRNHKTRLTLFARKQPNNNLNRNEQPKHVHSEQANMFWHKKQAKTRLTLFARKQPNNNLNRDTQNNKQQQSRSKLSTVRQQGGTRRTSQHDRISPGGVSRGREDRPREGPRCTPQPF